MLLFRLCVCCMIGCAFDIVFGFCVDCDCFCIFVTYLCRVVVRYSGPEHQCLAPFDAGQHPILYSQLQVVQENLRSSASSLHVPPLFVHLPFCQIPLLLG